MSKQFNIPKDTKNCIAKTMEESGIQLFWYDHKSKHPCIVFEMPSGKQGHYAFAPALKSSHALMNLRSTLRKLIKALKG